MAENTNAMGLDKFQLTIIKNLYDSIKSTIDKRDKLALKVKEFKDKMLAKIQEYEQSRTEELDAYNTYIKNADDTTAAYTVKTCGIALTCEQVMNFLKNPEEFEQYKKELGLGEDLFSAEEATVENPQEVA